MTLHALWLPVQGEPEVVDDPHWDHPALTARFGTDWCRIGLGWAPIAGRPLTLYGRPDGSGRPSNPAALALAGPRNPALSGPALLTVQEHDSTASLLEFELLVIGTRLLIGEITAHAIASA